MALPLHVTREVDGLPDSNVLQVRQCCEEKMIATHVAWLHTEAEIMIENEHRRNLSLLYPLLMPIPSGLAPLVQKLTQHITQQGMQAIGSLQGDNVRKREAMRLKYLIP